MLAHMWFNIAGANGNEDARRRRDNLERDMSRAEIMRATDLACACMDSGYQDCGRYGVRPPSEVQLARSARPILKRHL